MFEVALGNKVFERSDLFLKYFHIFWAEDKKLKKRLRLYELEVIDNQAVISVSANLKEHYEYYSNKNSNKRHKGVPRGNPGMTFEAFASCIILLHECKI